MNRLPLLLLSLSLLLAVPAFAAEGDSGADSGATIETVTTETEGGNVTVNVTLPAAVSVEPSSAENDSSEVLEDTPVSALYTLYALDETVSNDTDVDVMQLPALLVELFGEYQPRTQTVTEYLSDGSSVSYQQVIPGVAGMDFEWLSAVGLFALFLFCLMKLVGGLLKS